MPELPEVETIKRRLQEVILDKKIIAIEVRAPKIFQGQESKLVGTSISAVTRRAKILKFQLSSGLHLVSHLKMTGQLIYVHADLKVGGGHPTADWITQLPGSHTRIILTFDDASKLFFNDMRLFGWMKLLTQQQLEAEESQLGPDINDPSLTASYLYNQWQRRSIPIKQALMSNDIVCGVGNIYACDALNVAQISPFRPAKSLSYAEVERLLGATQQIIELGIERQGTTFDGKYLTADGLAGGYQDIILAYGRDGLPCYNCGTKLVKEKIAGRGTFFCPVCQV